MTSANVNLKVPFNEKDQAKALGARWNAEIKQWYVPEGINPAPFSKWITDAPEQVQNTVRVVPQAASSTSALDDDMDAINAKLRDAYEFREF